MVDDVYFLYGWRGDPTPRIVYCSSFCRKGESGVTKTSYNCYRTPWSQEGMKLLHVIFDWKRLRKARIVASRRLLEQCSSSKIRRKPESNTVHHLQVNADAVVAIEASLTSAESSGATAVWSLTDGVLDGYDDLSLAASSSLEYTVNTHNTRTKVELAIHRGRTSIAVVHLRC